MPEIKVYPDTFCKDLHETHQAPEGTLADWLSGVKGYDANKPPRFTATLNGRQLTVKEIAERKLTAGDKVEIYISPAEPGTILATIWTVVQVAAVAYSLYSYYKLSKQKKPGEIGEQATIYDPNVQANQPRLLGIIPEIFGRHKVFPDIISSPWREYVDHELYLNMLLCVGVGEYEIDEGEIFIANTPVSRYSTDIEYEIFQPGDNVTGNTAHQNIYSSPEVGANAAGQSGIELGGSIGNIGSARGGLFTWTFQDDTLRWTPDEVENDFELLALSIQALGRTMFPEFEVGEIIEINANNSNNDGFYRVDVSSSNQITVVKLLDDLITEDPDWNSNGQFVEDTDSTIIIARLGVDAAQAYAGPFLACPPSERTDTIYIDLLFPNGLGRIDENELLSLSRKIDIEYRDANVAGGWTQIQKTYTAATINQRGFTEQINIGSMILPEVRIRRATAKSNALEIADAVLWVGLRSKLQAASSYPGITTLAVRVKGTNAISSQSENRLNLVCTRKLQELSATDGFSGGVVATRHISSPVGYVIQDIGNSQDDIDLAELVRLDDIWRERGDTFDGVFLSDNTFFEALKQLVAPGFAVPVLDFGQISFVRDEVRTTYEHMYQPDNIVGGIEREITLVDEDEPDGIEVEYMDGEHWRPDTVPCLLDSDLGANPEKIRAFGVTDRTKAWQLGMRKRRERAYRRIRYKFATEMDALNSRFGSFCALGDDMPSYSQTGVVKAVDGRTLTLSQNLEWTSDAHFIALRKSDGTLSGPYVATQGQTDNEVEIDDDLDFTPVLDGSQEPPLFQFGTAERWTEPVLIAEIQPQGMDRVDVAAVNYDERVYLSDDEEPPS